MTFQNMDFCACKTVCFCLFYKDVETIQTVPARDEKSNEKCLTLNGDSLTESTEKKYTCVDLTGDDAESDMVDAETSKNKEDSLDRIIDELLDDFVTDDQTTASRIHATNTVDLTEDDHTIDTSRPITTTHNCEYCEFSTSSIEIFNRHRDIHEALDLAGPLKLAAATQNGKEKQFQPKPLHLQRMLETKKRPTSAFATCSICYIRFPSFQIGDHYLRKHKIMTRRINC